MYVVDQVMHSMNQDNIDDHPFLINGLAPHFWLRYPELTLFYDLSSIAQPAEGNDDSAFVRDLRYIALLLEQSSLYILSIGYEEYLGDFLICLYHCVRY